MATFGTIASAAPNVLFNPMAVDQAVQAGRRNDLLMEQNRLQFEDQRNDRRVQSFERDREHVARASAAILALPANERPAAYAAAVRELQGNGIALQAPPEYPGDQRLQMLSRQGLSVPQQTQMDERVQGRQAIQGLFGEVPTAPAAPVAAPAAPGGAPGPTATLEPRGVRNNNPLNLSFANQPGAVMETHATPRFARFETPEEGVNAALNQLRIYQRRGNTTLAGMINTWAPPSENDTRGYVQRVATMTGLAPDQPVNLDDPEVAARLVRAMARIETGRDLAPEVAQRGVAARTGGVDVAGPGAPTPAQGPGSVPPILQGLTPTQQATIRAMAQLPGANGQALLAQAESMRQHNQTQARREPTGPIAGQGIDSALLNILITGDPASPEYAAAYARLGAEEVLQNGSTRRPDMSPFRAPTYRPPAVLEPTLDAPRSPGIQADPPPPAGGRSYGRGEVTQAPPQPSAADRTRLRQIEVEASGIDEALTAFLNTRRDASATSRVATAAGVPTELSTSYANAALLAKGEALYNLGVLNGPDLSIIRRALADPATIRGATVSQDEVGRQVAQIRDLLNQRLATARAQYGGQADAMTPRPSGQPAAPAVGAVQEGYRFRGGNPGDPASWERVQ